MASARVGCEGTEVAGGVEAYESDGGKCDLHRGVSVLVVVVRLEDILQVDAGQPGGKLLG